MMYAVTHVFSLPKDPLAVNVGLAQMLSEILRTLWEMQRQYQSETDSYADCLFFAAAVVSI
jgi:hypothetical protein